MAMKKLIGVAGVLSLAVVLALSLANAGPRDGAQGKRDVIADAGVICGSDPFDPTTVLGAACLLRHNSDGRLIGGNGCTAGPGLLGDAGVLDYQLRNCDKNEEALLRKASSVVLSVNDFVDRGKDQQAEMAAGYACSYADKYDLLIGAGKLFDGNADLASDAQNIAAALGFPCL